jgi:hypothetical protein
MNPFGKPPPVQSSKPPENIYDWRAQPFWGDVNGNELIRALDQMSINTLQWFHQILHDLEGGGYIGDMAPKETLHDAIALILDHRDQYHAPPYMQRPQTMMPWMRT